MNMFKMCLNWKVIGALAAVAAAVYFVAPAALAAALPLLVLAICPLSMILMMKMMNGDGGGQNRGEATGQPVAAPVDHAATAEELDADLRRLRNRETAIAEQLEALRRDDRPQREQVHLPFGSSLS